MTYLTEDPLPLLIVLGVLAAACGIALRLTQQGRFLLWGGGFLAAALLFFVFERLWVTDAERVEAVVYALADAVERSDVEGVRRLLDPDLTLTRNDRILDQAAVFSAILAQLPRTQFDTVRISHLTARVGEQTRIGSAEFRAVAFGQVEMGGGGTHAFASGNTEWSLSFREAEPGRWVVTRVTPTRFPAYGRIPGFGTGR